jgi:hypothetical protein
MGYLYEALLPNFLYTFNIHLYMHIFRHIFLSNYWWHESEIWAQASYRYAILWSCLEKYDEKCAYMFNVCKNQLSRQTGSRNLTGPKTVPTIWHIYTLLVAFFSVTIDGRNLIFGHKLHIGTPYRGKCFLTRHIPTSCLPKGGVIIS